MGLARTGTIMSCCVIDWHAFLMALRTAIGRGYGGEFGGVTQLGFKPLRRRLGLVLASLLFYVGL